MHDPELPRGLQDADIEASDLTMEANREARLKRRGICAHGWLGPVILGESAMKCHDCGKVFASDADAYEARREALI